MVVSSYERKQSQKMAEKNIVCETLYYSINQLFGKTYVRSTDGKLLQNVANMSIKEKRYFLNDECVYIENKFNKNILHTAKSYNDEKEIIECPNCGVKSKSGELVDGCPFCKTNFNFGLNNISISKKLILYKFYTKKFWIIYSLVIALISLIFFIDSPTIDTLLFLPLIYGLIFMFFLFPGTIVYICYNIIVKSNQKNKYENYISKPDSKNIWKSDKNEIQFYNALNKNIINYIFDKKDLIDFDILENYGLNFIDNDIIEVNLLIRELYFDNKFYKELKKYKILMKYIDSEKIDESYKVISCLKCGASIDILNKNCPYCNNEVYYNINWLSIKIEEDICKAKFLKKY